MVFTLNACGLLDACVGQVIPGGGAAQTSFIVSGGQVVWQSDYIFLVSAATYYIQGVQYTSPESTVTLDAAGEIAGAVADDRQRFLGQ